jgi:hypothetical protein
LKKKLLSPLELKEFRALKEEQGRLRAEELEKKKLEERNKNKKLVKPSDLLDPKIEIEEEVIEEPVVEVVKEPIELLQEKVDDFHTQYSEELAQLEVRLSSKVDLGEINLLPINNNIKRLRQIIDELPEVKYYDDDLEKLTERVDQLQVSGSEIFQQHGENLKEVKKVIHQMLEDLVKLDRREIPEAFDPSDIQNDIAATKETFYERVAELKKELSELPEVKYYDDELNQLQERIETVKNSIPEIPEIKYYDDDLENLLNLIEDVRGNVSKLPEVKYYESEIAQLEESIKEVEGRIPTVPEVKYYEDDIEALREEIKQVEGKIPELPEVKSYDKDIKELRKEIKGVEGQIPEVKSYDEEVEILSEDIDKVRDSLIDIKLAIKAVEKSVEVVEDREIPEAFDPTGLQIEIEKAFKEIEKLKEQPVTVKEDVDPLTPLEDKFVTFDELSKHYRTFITRIQQQLASLGGGGEVNLRYLDDIDRSSISDGKVLSYDAATKKFKFISPGAASSLWSEQGANIYRNSNVGINSADPQVALDVVGDARISGILTVGTDTITVDSNLNRITIDAPGGNQIVIDGNDEIIRVGSGITIKGDTNTIQIGSDTIDGNSGDADFSGIVTAPAFVGEFVSTIDKTLEYQSGTLSTITTSEGTKTFYYDGAGILTSIVGTGVYVSKEFTYDGGGNLISVNVL